MSHSKPGIIENARLQDVQVKARFGHKDWICWKDQAGNTRAEWRSADSIKRMLLTVGTKGWWCLVNADSGTLTRGFWWLGINIWAQSKRGWA